MRITKRLENEFKSLSSNPICGAKIFKENDNIYKWKISLPGPKGSPYEGGNFDLDFNLINYPFKSPDVKFINKIYHPNIQFDNGEICNELFAKDWCPTNKIEDIILKISSLLFLPVLENPLEPNIAEEYINNYESFQKNVIECIKNGNFAIKKEPKIEKLEENKQLLFPENEEEEQIQILLAQKESEEIAKINLKEISEENKQIEKAIEESKKEVSNNSNNVIIDINNININDKIEEDKEEEKFDEEYGICPITQDYMENPVIVPSGNYYEKSAIIEWIEKNHNDPLTRENLTIDMLVEDHEYRQKIIEYRKKFNK